MGGYYNLIKSFDFSKLTAISLTSCVSASQGQRANLYENQACTLGKRITDLNIAQLMLYVKTRSAIFCALARLDADTCRP
jgi:hypothetical protein